MGPSVRAMAARQASAVSGPSAGRMTRSRGMARSAARCSTGWWVGPSPPSPIESWVQTYTTGRSIRLARRTLGRM